MVQIIFIFNLHGYNVAELFFATSSNSKKIRLEYAVMLKKDIFTSQSTNKIIKTFFESYAAKFLTQCENVSISNLSQQLATLKNQKTCVLLF